MLGVISVVIRDPQANAGRVNDLVGSVKGIVRGRMGLPFAERDLAVVVLVVDGDQDELNALSGRLGRLPGTAARVVFAPQAVENEGGHHNA
jgi:putative iron-only hydrogenase system regulator